MNLKSKTLIAIIWAGLLIVPTVLFGQATIKLKTGSIQPAANLESFINSPNVLGDEVFENKYFRLITFNEIPSENVRVSLESAGIFLYNYLPDRTYMAGIAVNANLEQLRSASIQSIISFDPNWKLNKDLFSGSYPAWSLKQTGKVDLVVRYHKGLNADLVIESLVSKGATLLRRYDYGRWAEIRIDEGRHMEIASPMYSIVIRPWVVIMTAMAFLLLWPMMDPLGHTSITRDELTNRIQLPTPVPTAT